MLQNQDVQLVYPLKGLSGGFVESKSMKKRWLTMMILAAVWVVWLAEWSQTQSANNSKEPVAEAGVLDLSSWDLEADGTVQLKGEWEFYWHRLLTADDLQGGQMNAERQVVQVPNVWTDYQDQHTGEDYPGHGYATYRLKVITNGNMSTFGLKIPDVSTACKVMIDHEVVATCGEVADNKQQAYAQYAPQAVHFTAAAPQFDLIVQISNYLYDRGGMWYALELGTEVQVARQRENGLAVSLFLFGVFMFMGLYHMVIYMLRRKEKVALYFAAGCFIGAARLLVIDEIYLLNLFPQVPIEWIIGTIYVSYYGGIMVLTYYLRELYPQEISRRVAALTGVISGMFLLTIFVLPVHMYTHMIRYYHFFMIVLGMVLVYGVLLAVWRRREGSKLQFIGIFIFVLTVIHDIFFNMYYISEFINNANIIEILDKQIVVFGLLVLMFVQAIVLAQRSTNALSSVENMSQRLISLDRLKDEFLVNTSHELKTPLHGIINLSQSMIEGANGPLSKEQEKILSSVVSAARRLTNLIQDITDFTKLKNSDIQLNKASVSLQAVLLANEDIFRRYIGGKPVQLLVNLPDQLPNVYADEDRLLQILYNLIGNAIKFTDRGFIEVTAEADDDRVSIHIRDSGIGIPRDKQELIFESFEQVGSAVSREYGGTGLGLSITKKLVELNGGRLFVESEVGVGSTFTFTLPVSLQQHQPAVPVQTQRIIQPVSPHHTAASTAEVEFTLLAVDDDATNLQVISNVFAASSYRVLTAPGGAAALEILAENDGIDLVIVDVMMPGMTGYEVTRKIRTRYTLSELPVLLVTVKNEPEDMLNGFSAGANDFLSKPFYTHELRARVRNLLEMKRSAEEAVSTKLDFLRAQIKPHFIYNALNTVVGLCIHDPQKASYILTELSHFLRGSFDFQSKQKYVTLEEELELVESYTIIEKARFEERLKLEYDVDRQLTCMVPPLSIQPLVENAIRHGAMSKIDGGTVKITVKERESYIYIAVEDDGPGMSENKLEQLLSRRRAPNSGVGLSNIQRRLVKLYGSGLKIESRQGHGTKVMMNIPKEKGVRTT